MQKNVIKERKKYKGLSIEIKKEVEAKLLYQKIIADKYDESTVVKKNCVFILLEKLY